jgi:predicted nucleic acid-binding protein
MIVLDASIVAAALGDDSDAGHRIREALQDDEPFAPELIDLEVASYMRRAVRAGRLGSQRAIQLLADLALLPVSRVSHTPLLSRVWELRDNLTPYDASYVALAETMGAPLITADARLSRAPGIHCEVRVLS